MRLINKILPMLAALSLSSSAFAQQTVTTSGGTQDSVAKFNGPSSITNSTISETSSGSILSVSIGTPATDTGGLSVRGNWGGLSFWKRSLTSAPTVWHAGDFFSWYNPDGSVRLWTPENNDIVTISKEGNTGFGVAGGPGGGIASAGRSAAFSFLKRTLTSQTQNPGDAYAWYNPDGSARLWTWQTGDVLSVRSNGELDLAGALRFPDGTTQTTATVQGPAGAPGPAGSQGPAGPQGPQGVQGVAGPAIHTSAFCSDTAFVGGTTCSQGNTLVSRVAAPCTVTSDTGSCSATPASPGNGACLVCKPN